MKIPALVSYYFGRRVSQKLYPKGLWASSEGVREDGSGLGGQRTRRVCLRLAGRYLRTILDAADRSSAGARAREGRIGRCNGRLAEACSARERPGRGGRWCGLNDRTLMCEVVLCVGHKATKPPNNIRYSRKSTY